MTIPLKGTILFGIDYQFQKAGKPQNMKQLLLIINPVSGTRKGQRVLCDMISVFNRASFDTHVFITAARGDATRVVEERGALMDLIVCCGGDGTLNETITGLIRAGVDVPLGYIPTGSTNDFASSLKLSGDPVVAARQIAGGRPRRYDVGRFQERYFSYVASFGAFTRASYATPQNLKNALGHLAYLLEGVQELPRLRNTHIRMELDGEVVEGDYLFGAICNSTSVGGVLSLDPEQVDMSDGVFEVMLVRAPRDVQELLDCEAALRTHTYDCGMITYRKASCVNVTADPEMVWTLDGERADGSEHIQVENLHQRIALVY